MARQRWFGGKSRRIVAVSVEDRVPLPGGDLVIVAVHLDDRTADRYAVPLGEGDGDEIVDGLDTVLSTIQHFASESPGVDHDAGA